MTTHREVNPEWKFPVIAPRKSRTQKVFVSANSCLAAAIGLLLAAPGTAHADPDPIGYLNALRRDGVEASDSGSNADLIRGGRYMCAELIAGKSPYNVAAELYEESKLGSLEKAERVVADAITYLCPQAR